MKKIEATIAPFTLGEVRDALIGCRRRRDERHRGQGARSARARRCYRGTEYVRVRAALQDRGRRPRRAGRALRRRRRAAMAGERQLARSSCCRVEETIRIRTGEHQLARCVTAARCAPSPAPASAGAEAGLDQPARIRRCRPGVAWAVEVGVSIDGSRRDRYGPTEAPPLRARDEPGQLGAVDDARARAVEVGVAVDAVDAPVAHRRERLPLGTRAEPRQLAPRLLELEAARHEDDHVGRDGDQRRPSRSSGCARRRATELVGAAAELDQLGNPVAGDHQRVEPLDAGDARPAARVRDARARMRSSRSRLRATSRAPGVGARRPRRRRARSRRARRRADSACSETIARRRVEQRPRRRARPPANDTAHTSHCSCVTIRSGRAARSASSSMR